MARDERRYDFGLRGYPQTTRPLIRRSPRRNRFDPFSAEWYAGPDREIPPTPRVTRRYNEDYVDDRLNTRRSGGWSEDRFDHLTGAEGYSAPYRTVGGTRTGRGSGGARGRDSSPGRFGPTYGGRFPDEL